MLRNCVIDRGRYIVVNIVTKLFFNIIFIVIYFILTLYLDIDVTISDDVDNTPPENSIHFAFF